MISKVSSIVAALCALVAAGSWTAPAQAQTTEVKDKPPMYSYVANWAIPRAGWPEFEKGNATTQKVLDKAVAAGVLVGYGDDVNLVHQPDGYTHDNWWSSMSMAGLLNTLDEIHKAGSAGTAPLVNATKHGDSLYVTRFYNWHAGSWKGAYSHAAVFKLKPDAGNDAVASLSKNVFVPLFEKLLADGTIVEYEVDVEAIHTEAPGTFVVFYITPTAEGIDKVNAAFRENGKKNSLIGPALNSMVDFAAHRDYLSRANATFK